MNTLSLRQVVVLALAGTMVLGGTSAATKADAKSARGGKRAKINALADPPAQPRADPPAQPRTPTMRYFGGPKSPMWPAQ
jgi:hypothetical protein